jgi:hypothetical protein
VNGIVRDLHVHNDHLIASGNYASIEGLSIQHLAKWDGQSWSSVGIPFNLQSNQFIWSLATHEGFLIAGGDFAGAGNPGNRVARFNGTSWQGMGAGFSDRVRALGVHNAELFASGKFVDVQGKDFLRRIALWNGSSWVSVGEGLNGVPRTMTSLGPDLIAGGSFGASGGGVASRIARWDGEDWSGLGSGTNHDVTCAWGRDLDLYMCGQFESAGLKPAHFIALWTDEPLTPTDAPVVVIPDGGQNDLTLFPNPFRESTTIRYSISSPGRVSLQLFDVAGRRIHDLVETFQDEGEHRVTWNGIDSAGRPVVPGVYFYRLEGPAISRTGKLVRVATR